MLDQSIVMLWEVKALIPSTNPGSDGSSPCLALVSRALSLQVRISRQTHLTRMARAYPWQEREGKERWRIKSTSGVCWSCRYRVVFSRSLGAAFAFQANGDTLHVMAASFFPRGDVDLRSNGPLQLMYAVMEIFNASSPITVHRDICSRNLVIV